MRICAIGLVLITSLASGCGSSGSPSNGVAVQGHSEVSVRGRVVDGVGQPVSKVEVAAFRGQQELDQAVTDSNGLFVLTLAPGPISVVGAGQDQVTDQVSLEAGQASIPVTLVAQRLGALSGEALPGTLIALHEAEALDAIRYATTTSQGTFSFDELPPGEYSLAYHPPSRASGPAQALTYQAVRVASGVTASAPPSLGKEVHRLLVATAAGPLSSAEVAVFGPLGHPGAPPENRILTFSDAIGRVALPSVPPGNYTVAAAGGEAIVSLSGTGLVEVNLAAAPAIRPSHSASTPHHEPEGESCATCGD